MAENYGGITKNQLSLLDYESGAGEKPAMHALPFSWGTNCFHQTRTTHNGERFRENLQRELFDGLFLLNQRPTYHISTYV